MCNKSCDSTGVSCGELEKDVQNERLGGWVVRAVLCLIIISKSMVQWFSGCFLAGDFDIY